MPCSARKRPISSGRALTSNLYISACVRGFGFAPEIAGLKRFVTRVGMTPPAPVHLDRLDNRQPDVARRVLLGRHDVDDRERAPVECVDRFARPDRTDALGL